MNILITGNMGYVGPGVVEQLRQQHPGDRLCGVDTGYFANCLTNAGVLPESRLDVQIFADVRKPPAGLFQSVDAVVHLSAISNDPMGSTFEAVTYNVNHAASIALARQAKAAGVKSFVFASTCSMYGLANDRPKTESSTLNPLTAYAKSKVLAEQDLRPLAGDGFTVTCLRFATACGMSDRLRLDLVLNDFVAGAVASGRISILSDGTPWRPLINVRDMARAIDWAVRRSPDNGGTFLAVNGGSDAWNYQVKDLAEAVAEAIPGVEVSINKDAPPEKRSYRVDFGLFKKLAPDHQPQCDLRTTILDLKRGLEAMGFDDANFRGSGFMRLKFLTFLREQGLLNEKLEWVWRS